MADVCLRAPRAGDAEYLAPRLRRADVVECHAVGVTDLEQALRAGLERSVLAWVAEVDGEPVAALGVAPIDGLMGDRGAAWMLGTDLVTRHQWALMRLAPGYIERMLSAFSHLLNFVHADNHAAVRWLKRMGFTVHPAQPHGPHGALFHFFEMKADHV